MLYSFWLTSYKNSNSLMITMKNKKAITYVCDQKLKQTFATVSEKLATSTLQTYQVYSTSKLPGSDRFHVVSTWNTPGMFVGEKD